MTDNPKKKPSKPAASAAATEELQRQVVELTEALQRERADAMNVRRRAEEERVRMAGYHKAAVVRELLPVIDNFERALKHVPQDLQGNDYMKGIEAVIKQFERALSDLGVARIPTVGQPFDPRYHEAVQMEDGEGTQEVVSEELQSGYVLGDEVLRHAMVKVRMR